MLQRVAERICIERGIGLRSDQATDLAAEIVTKFQSGVIRESNLLQSLRT